MNNGTYRYNEGRATHGLEAVSGSQGVQGSDEVF